MGAAMDMIRNVRRTFFLQTDRQTISERIFGAFQNDFLTSAIIIFKLSRPKCSRQDTNDDRGCLPTNDSPRVMKNSFF